MIVVLLANCGNVHIPCPECKQYNIILPENVPTDHMIHCGKCAHIFENPVGQVPIYVGTEKLLNIVSPSTTTEEEKLPVDIQKREKESDSEHFTSNRDHEKNSSDDEETNEEGEEDEAFQWVVVDQDPTWDIC